jgi:hypothetical protein
MLKTDVDKQARPDLPYEATCYKQVVNRLAHLRVECTLTIISHVVPQQPLAGPAVVKNVSSWHPTLAVEDGSVCQTGGVTLIRRPHPNELVKHCVNELNRL